MPKYRYDIEQNTDEWEAVRIGKFTASICSDLLMKKENKGYSNLIARVVEERITGKKSESSNFKGNYATNRGHELEPIARVDYEFRTLKVVKTIGVIELDDWTLCSPDGLIGDDLHHQIKCPLFNTQLEYLKKNKVPTNYYNQVQFELYVSGRSGCVFTCYHPNLPPLDILINRDEDVLQRIDTRLKEAKEEVTKEIELIKNL